MQARTSNSLEMSELMQCPEAVDLSREGLQRHHFEDVYLGETFTNSHLITNAPAKRLRDNLSRRDGGSDAMPAWGHSGGPVLR